MVVAMMLKISAGYNHTSDYKGFMTIFVLILITYIGRLVF